MRHYSVRKKKQANGKQRKPFSNKKVSFVEISELEKQVLLNKKGKTFFFLEVEPLMEVSLKAESSKEEA